MLLMYNPILLRKKMSFSEMRHLLKGFLYIDLVYANSLLKRKIVKAQFYSQL